MLRPSYSKKGDALNASVKIDAGVCGFQTTAEVSSSDGQTVLFRISSDCVKIKKMAEALCEHGPVNAFVEMRPGGKGLLLGNDSPVRDGRCAGCVVPLGLFKGMQVAVGMALPRDVNISLDKK